MADDKKLPVAPDVVSEDDVDYDPDILTLEDDEGQEFSLEVIDTLEYHGNTYLAVCPYSEDPAQQLESDDTLIIIRMIEDDSDGNGMPEYEEVTEPKELNAVSAEFATRFRELYGLEIDTDNAPIS